MTVQAREISSDVGRPTRVAPSSNGLYRRLALGLALTDAACITAALVVSRSLQSAIGRDLPGSLLVDVGVVVVTVVVLAGFKLYDLARLSPSEEFKRLVLGLGLSTTVVIAGSFWVRTPLSRTSVGVSWILMMVFVTASRRLWHVWLGRVRASGRLALRTLVVGSNGEVSRIVRWMQSPGSGFQPVGVVEASPDHALGDEGTPVVGDLSMLETLIVREAVECVFVASTSVAEEHMSHLLRAARRHDVKLWVSANLPEVLASRVAPRSFGDMIALSLRPVRLTGWQAFVKRAFDLLMSIVTLVLLSPVMLAIAIAIRLESPGPVLFRQSRATRHNRPFTMLKFRTMFQNADSMLAERGIDPTAPFFKLGDGDPRLTRVGRFLRRTSLNELPQLVNIFRGAMSLVGPRPLPLDQVRAHPELLTARHEVRSGLTGWWQVNGRSDVDAEAAVRMDAFYVENWSLWLDLFVLLKTFGAVLRRRGAR
jgi:exopolysaccharide biosynthesis polyprenyl glycosylphosphotransferase